jgi:hypothetical protein
MPNMDGTGPDGKGPKKENKGWPSRDGRGKGKGKRHRTRLARGERKENAKGNKEHK